MTNERTEKLPHSLSIGNLQHYRTVGKDRFFNALWRQLDADTENYYNGHDLILKIITSFSLILDLNVKTEVAYLFDNLSEKIS